jgi:predicted MFS family arabinose efflux permease
MDPIAFQAALRVAVLILIVAVAMLPFQPPNSPEFVVTVLAAIVGLIFVVLVAVVVRLSTSRPPNPRPVDTVSGIDSNMRNEEPRRGK